MAAAFNAPLRVQYGSQSIVQKAMLDVKGPFKVAGASNVLLDTVKRGDDDDYLSKGATKSVICRLYESKGGHARAELVTTLPVRKATIVDLLERNIEDVEIVSSPKSDCKKRMQLAFRGFQVVTVKLELGEGSDNTWTDVDGDYM